MVLLGLACDTLNFSVVIRWWLIFQEYPDWMYPIIFWFLIWIVNYHHILLDCFIGCFCWLDRRLEQLFNNDVWRSWCFVGSNPCLMIGITVVQSWDIPNFKSVEEVFYPMHFC
jgi:hypothetical protein